MAEDQQATLQQIADTVNLTKSKVDETYKILVGNGDVGLCEEVRNLKEWRKSATRVNYLLIAAAVSLIGKIVYELLAHQ